MILIRADANDTIATGHVMRCLSIAKELKKHGEEVKFVIADHLPEEMIRNHGYETICLHSQWNHMESELDDLVSLIERLKVSMILVDSYYVTEKYLRTLREHTRVAYIDDMDAFLYPVDLLINYNMYAETLDYEKRYRDAGLDTQFALGVKYAPLREEFCNVKKIINKKISKVLITTGGADIYNVAGYLLDAFANQRWFQEMEYYVVIGKFNQNKDSLSEKWCHDKNVHLLTNVSCMAEYMKLCDVAVTAGGVTTYELCACGIPSIMYTLADNQWDNARAISEKGLMPWVGDVRDGMEICMKATVGQIEIYMKDKNRCLSISQRMQNEVDGKGSINLKKKIKMLIDK